MKLPGILPADWEARQKWMQLPFERAEYEDRLRRLQALMDRKDLSALLLFAAPKQSGNLRWIANFDSYVGYSFLLIAREGEPVLGTDSLFRMEPMQSGAWMTWVRDYRPARPVAADPDGLLNHLKDAVSALPSGTRIGFVGEDAFTYELSSKIRREIIAPDRIADSTYDYLAAKAIKSPAELALIRKVVEAGVEGLKAARRAARHGVTESEVAAEAVAAMFRAGSQNLYGPFPVCVVSGQRTALKNVAPTNRIIERGDLVFLDIEPEVEGYGTDLARVMKVDETARDDELNFLECARLGLEAAIEATAPGKTLAEIEAAALDVAVGMGYSARYCLKGHGLGTTKFRDVPRPVEKDYVLRPGETVNYESILLDERFGCATLEDTVQVTETAREVLSRCERKWW
ncbi:MAG: M24 family metallopeptidase [Nitrospinota bacterium]